MNKQLCLNDLRDLRTHLRWALSKANMAECDINNDSSGGVCNEMSDVIMSIEFALNRANAIVTEAKKR